MHRIHLVLADLEPVARIVNLIGLEIRDRAPRPEIVFGKGGHFLGRAHIGEDNAGEFMGRIGALEGFVLDPAFRRLTRGFQDRAVAVEQPAVIAAADAPLLDLAEFERGAAVAAMLFEQGRLA